MHLYREFLINNNKLKKYVTLSIQKIKMYYLDRQQGEKFYNWARRVFKRFNEIKGEIETLLSDFAYETYDPVDDLFYTIFNMDFRILYPNFHYFLENSNFPR